MAKNEKLLENVTEDGKKRWKFYLAMAILIVGVAVATVIWLGVITEEDFNRWVVLVGVVVSALFGLAGNIRAMLNPEKQHDVPQTGITDRDQVM